MASAQAHGQFIVKFSDQVEANPTPVYNGETQVISGGAKAAPTSTTLMAIPYIGLRKVRTGGRVLVYFKANATVTIESEESQWELPCLLMDERNNVVDNITLTQENMTGFTQAGTVDVVATINLPARLAYYDVPRGLYLMLDPNGRARAYFGDNA